MRPSTNVMGSNVNLGSCGVTGVQKSFSLKFYNLFMFHSMHVHRGLIDPLHYIKGSNVNQRSFSVTGVKFSVTQHGHTTHTSISLRTSACFIGSNVNLVVSLGSFRYCTPSSLVVLFCFFCFFFFSYSYNDCKKR